MARADAGRKRGRRAGIAGLILALGAAAALAPLWVEERPPPLVLLVVFDALRADHLSQYGYPLDTSPGLDPVAESGAVFLRHYAPTSYTTASTASLFTGQSPLRHGARVQGARLAPELRTLPEVLRARGYATRGVSFNPVVSDATGFTQGFDDFVEREPGSPFNLYPDIERGLEVIRGWIDAADGPLFVYFQPMNTHGPYRVPREAQDVLLGRPPRSDFRYYGQPMAGILAGDVARREEVTAGYVRSAVERYDTAIRYATDALGALLDELRAAGRFDEALVVVTADHGDEFFEHGGFSHGYTLHEEVLRVPLLVKLPHQREARRIGERVALTDVFATIADAVGADAGPAVDSRSLVPLIRGEGEVRDPDPLPLLVDFAPRLRASGLLHAQHKLVSIEERYDGTRKTVRLYDLEADPGERRDLAAARPERTRELQEMLSGIARRLEAEAEVPTASVAEDLDRERLRALGYAR